MPLAGAPKYIGNYSVVAHYTSNNPEYLNADSTPVAFSVTPAPLIVTADNQTKTYGSTFTAFTGSVIGIQNGDNITASYASDGEAATAGVAGGPYTIAATLNDPSGKLGNYTVTYNTGNLTVMPAPLTVTPDNQTKVYGSTFTAFTGSVTGIQNGDNITASYASNGAAATAGVAGGPYAITASLNDPDRQAGQLHGDVQHGQFDRDARAADGDARRPDEGLWQHVHGVHRLGDRHPERRQHHGQLCQRRRGRNGRRGRRPLSDHRHAHRPGQQAGQLHGDLQHGQFDRDAAPADGDARRPDEDLRQHVHGALPAR